MDVRETLESLVASGEWTQDDFDSYNEWLREREDEGRDRREEQYDAMADAQ